MASATILLPLDGTPAAEQAIPWAVNIALKTNATLKVVRVFFPPMPTYGEGMMAADPSLYQEVKDNELSYINAMQQKLTATHPGLHLTAELIEADDTAAGMIADYAKQHGVELTVMTTHGRGSLARFVMGSAADEFLQRSAVPTLLIRVEDDQATPAEPKGFTKVIVPLDGSDLGEMALPVAMAMAKHYDAAVELYTVLEGVEDIQALTGKSLGPAEAILEPHSAVPAARTYLEGLQVKHAGQAKEIKIRLEEHGEVAHKLIGCTDPEHLVVLASHGRGGLSRMLFGSVTDQVLRSANGPVLVVRPMGS
jgi:nucleotide-binding universal stress UspA family protein